MLDFDPNRVFQDLVLVLDAERVLITVTLLDDEGLISDAHAHAALLLIPDGVMVRGERGRRSTAPFGREASKTMR